MAQTASVYLNAPAIPVILYMGQVEWFTPAMGRSVPRRAVYGHTLLLLLTTMSFRIRSFISCDLSEYLASFKRNKQKNFALILNYIIVFSRVKLGSLINDLSGPSYGFILSEYLSAYSVSLHSMKKQPKERPAPNNLMVSMCPFRWSYRMSLWQQPCEKLQSEKYIY